jgi:beta-1,2-rhamnosyltransferase WsaF-like protein
VSRLERMVRRALGRPRAAAGEDPFVRFRSVSGPRLVSGPTPRHDPALDADPRVVVLLPHLDVERMSGGPNTVFQVTARLLRHGMRLRYVATSGPLRPDRAALADHVRRITGVDAPADAVGFVEASTKRASLDLGRGDVVVASWWPTAHTANAALAHIDAPEFLYVVQDYEPGFYSWSTKSALAESTYAMPMRPIVNEPFLEAFLCERGIGRFAEDALPYVTFLPAVDRVVFRPLRSAAAGGSTRRLVFYARPRNPRNLFEIGLRALRQAVAEGVFEGARWEFVAIGQELPELPLSDRHVLRCRPWMSYEAYGELLGSSDVLLSLMLSPHTSYPPLEMAAAGGIVVTNTYGPKTAEALAAISQSILAAAPEVDALVATLRRAVAMPAPATQEMTLPATWDAALSEVVPWVATQVRELQGNA